MSMVAVLVKAVPPELNWSARKLPVAAPPALIDTVPVIGVAVGVGVSVGPPPEALNFHQLKLNRKPLPPVNLRYKSCIPVALLTVQVFVTQVCQPPVPGTAQVPKSVPA